MGIYVLLHKCYDIDRHRSPKWLIAEKEPYKYPTRKKDKKYILVYKWFINDK